MINGLKCMDLSKKEIDKYTMPFKRRMSRLETKLQKCYEDVVEKG